MPKINRQSGSTRLPAASSGVQDATPPTPTANMTVEDELIELRRQFLTSLSDQLKSKTVTGSVLAVVERVLSSAGLLGKQVPPMPELDTSTLPFKAPEAHDGGTEEQPEEQQEQEADLSSVDLPFKNGAAVADHSTSHNDEAWRQLDQQPFVVS